MGCAKIYLVNRTAAKLEELVKSFPKDYNLEIVETEQQADKASKVLLAVSCIPADKPLDGEVLKKIERILSNGSEQSAGFKPTLLEASYKPRVTPIMKLTEEQYKWKVIPGVEMLVNQGDRQFKLHTGFTAPYEIIHRAVVEE